MFSGRRVESLAFGHIKRRMFRISLWYVLASLFLGLVYWIFYASFHADLFPDWTGFNTREVRGLNNELEAYYPSRTLWDWLNLLLIPVMLAVGGISFTWFESRQSRWVEHTRAQDVLIEGYLNQMTELLLSQGLRTSLEGDEVRSVARARTLTTLRNVDGSRKSTIVQFLYESGLIGHIDNGDETRHIVNLHGASLEKIIFNVMFLRGINLEHAYLEGADLRWSRLDSANFRGAALIDASFRGADLRGARLDRATLGGADFRGAVLIDADLRGSSLRGARLDRAILDKANLTYCEGVTLAQLLRVRSLHGTKLPEGINGIALGDKWSPPEDEDMPECEP